MLNSVLLLFSFIFRKCHPEQFPTPEMRHQAASSEGPNKPTTAFNIFVSDRLKKPDFTSVIIALNLLSFQLNTDLYLFMFLCEYKDIV